MSTTDNPTSVIHDIGYRSWDGPRNEPPAITRALYVDSLRNAFGIGRSTRAKIAPILLLLVACGPPLIGTMVTILTGMKESFVGYSTYATRIEVLVALFLAICAPPLLSRDLRHRIVSLYFSRPITRTQYIAARVAALATAAFIYLAVPQLVIFIGALLAELPVSEQLPEFLRGLGTSALLAVILASLASLIASLAQRRGIGVALIVGTFTVLTAVQAIVSHILYVGHHPTGVTWSAVLSPFDVVRRLAYHLLRADISEFGSPQWSAGFGMLAVWAAYIVLALGALVIRFRRVSVS